MPADQFLNLFEMPIGTWQPIGDFTKNASFKNADRALVSHPKAIEKARQKFLHTRTQFDFYFINLPGAAQHMEIGEVDPQWPFRVLKLQPDLFNQMKFNPEAVTVFFTNNRGDEKIPMTAWIVAHRFAHVISRFHGNGRGQVPEYNDMKNRVNEVFRSILGDFGVEISAGEANGNTSYYGNDSYAKVRQKQNILRYFAQSVGTMKSARDGNLRNFYEFHHELFAQYLTTGSITFKPLPRSIVTGYTYGRPQYRSLQRRDNYEAACEELQSLAEEFPSWAENVLQACEGRFFVM